MRCRYTASAAAARLVARVCRRLHVAHVAGAGESEQPAPPVQQAVEVVEVEAGLPVQVDEHGRIDVAGAGAHHETLERRHPHARLHRHAPVDRGDGGPVAEVEHDRLRGLERAAEHPGDLLRHVLVRRAVKAVPADAVLGRERRVDGVGVRRRGKGVVKGGVEHGNVRQARQCGARRADALQIRWIVQRGERRQLLDAALDLVVDEDRLGESRPAVHHPVADRGDPFGRVERVEHAAEAGLVVRHRGSGLTDPLDQPAQHGLARFEIDELVLDRRRTRVDDEDAAHASPPVASAWMAVIATVFTMS